MEQAKIEPQNFVDEKYIEMYKDQNMFFECLKFIITVIIARTTILINNF